MERLFILTAVLLCLTSPLWAAYQSNRRNNPLRGDDGKKHLRATECHFGKTIRELGTTWFPDLGPPFGVMSCIRCECVPVQKKRRIVARVQCRNIINECPKPTCDEPVLMPGHCCKICAGDMNVSDPRDIPAAEEEKNMKHFGSLLTARSSLVFKRDDIVNIPSTSDNPAYQIVATGRFMFHKKNLYYSFYMSNALNQIPRQPRAIQFINYKGDLLEEHILTVSWYQNATGKICGVWRRLPREYKRLLRDEALYVALLWNNDLALSGRITRFKASYTEQFTGLMTPPSSSLIRSDGGGTAIVSVYTMPSANSIHMAHLSLIFNGVFTPSETSDVPLLVSIESNDRSFHEEIIRISKPSSEMNTAEVRFTISPSDLRQLSRGKTTISISSRSHPDLMFVKGPILSRATCEIYQTPLAPTTDLEQQSSSVGEGAGLAWMYVTRDGSLAYSWQVEGIGDPSVALYGKSPKILQALNASNSEQNSATGVLDKLPPRSVEQLYAGELSVRVVGDRGILKGHLLQRPVGSTIDFPSLLTGMSRSTTELVGLAWMTIDSIECDLHYEVHLAGARETNSFQLYLEDTPHIAPNAPVSRRLLEDFNGTLLEGFVQLTIPELHRISSRITFLEVLDLQTGRMLLRGTLKPIAIPVDCLAGNNNVPREQPHSTFFPEMETKCFHEGIFYDDSSQWRHSKDPCRMCYCKRGKASCDDIVCPPLSCANGSKINKEYCCPSCIDSNSDLNSSSGCQLAGVFYPAASSWHPYLPPNGFNKCLVVSCNASTLSTTFTKVHCPPLKCAESEQVRPSKNGCCKVCGEKYLRDEPDLPVNTTWRTNDDIIQQGGCKYAGQGPFLNNSTWTHSIPSIGITPCITCHCQNGKVTCGRVHCTRTECSKSSSQLSALAPGMEECCNSKCRRYRRQSRHRKTGGGNNHKV